MSRGKNLWGEMLAMQLLNKKYRKKITTHAMPHSIIASVNSILCSKFWLLRNRQRAHTPPLHVVKLYKYGHTRVHEETKLRRDLSIVPVVGGGTSCDQRSLQHLYVLVANCKYP